MGFLLWHSGRKNWKYWSPYQLMGNPFRYELGELYRRYIQVYFTRKSSKSDIFDFKVKKVYKNRYLFSTKTSQTLKISIFIHFFCFKIKNITIGAFSCKINLDISSIYFTKFVFERIFRQWVWWSIFSIFYPRMSK